MSGTRQINYFRIGSFVMSAIILLILAILILGSGLFFKNVVQVETYFSESVQGLSIGSPVKYLGMQIGKVDNIATVASVYNLKRNRKGSTYNRYIYVRMEISSNFFASSDDDKVVEELKKDIAAGLRVKLAMQGLTGNAYLELDYVNGANTSNIRPEWQPDNLYIPSTVSTLTYFSDNVQLLLKQLSKVNFKRLFDHLDFLLRNVGKTAVHSDQMLANNRQNFNRMMNNLQSVTSNLETISERAKAFAPSMFFGSPPRHMDPNKL
ncbi:MAG: MCE family protein [Gammaproteobacteria bacterium]|nr:MCE family protein [Gammaproteobacteria bacterium]